LEFTAKSRTELKPQVITEESMKVMLRSPPSVLPKTLGKTVTHSVRQANGGSIDVPKVNPRFQEWKGARDNINTYGGKALINFRGELVFAEIAILKTFEDAGWEGGWIDTYRNKVWSDFPDRTTPSTLSGEAVELYERLKAANGGSRSGFWDVFVWKGDEVVFAEAKRANDDQINSNQEKWLEAALSTGLQLKSFLIVEWSLTD
jgi:hypothetical protein